MCETIVTNLKGVFGRNFRAVQAAFCFVMEGVKAALFSISNVFSNAVYECELMQQ